ncbi:D-arabinitol 2-dehydrogenase [Colletotrichum tropicale]|nr:D-arabinitol 2-dehydrogenase [Colletotrichum tropicale]
MSNTADPSFREVKARQGGSTTRAADLFRLDGRTIIITGGAGYLGVEVAQAVLEAGGNPVCLDIVTSPPSEPWNQLEKLAAKFGLQLSYYHLDLTNENSITTVFKQLAPTLKYPIRGLINVTGTFAAAQAVALEMKKANVDGSMVLVASMSGTNVNKGVDTAAYNSSKSAILQLARSLAAEWGSRKGMPLIRVNSLSPGYIRTPATAEALQKPGMENQWTGDNMLYRLSSVDEFRGPVLFLLGDASSFMTAADLRVDGGHCAW